MGIAFLLACAIGDPATDITIGMGMLQKSLVINQPYNTCCRVNFTHMGLASNRTPRQRY
ncbi:hypothetical protein ECTHUN648_04540 [Escherichia coli]|nr:hypothetical protein ECTHUN648_04540 [Escherichia coli]